MVKHSGTHRYTLGEREKGELLVKAKASNLPVKFKNLVEVSKAIRCMSINRAYAYLQNVSAKKECIPARKFKSGIGRCAQAKQFKTVIGRWPRNAAKCMIDLLKNVTANCEYLGKDPADYHIHHIQASQAPTSTRRTYRAHGRINPYMRHNCHLQIIIKPKEE